MESLNKHIQIFINKHFKITKNKDIKAREQLKGMVFDNIKNNNFNFSTNLKYRKVNKFGKRRMIASFDEFSTEFYLSKYIGKIIKNKHKDTKKNYHEMLDGFLNDLNNINSNKNFTIVMFDFKNYYNSISSEYAYNLVLKNMNFSSFEQGLIKKYSSEVDYAFAGLSPSNIYGEIMANFFENKLKSNMKDQSIISTVRYGDDFLLLLDTNIEESEIKNIITQTLNQVFYNKKIKSRLKNKVGIHLEGVKFSYISSLDLPKKIDMFGYEISLYKDKEKLNFKLGVSNYLKSLYKKSLTKLVKENYNKPEKLKVLLTLNTKRFAYTKKTIENKSKIVSLNYLLDKKLLVKHKDKIANETICFYKNILNEVFKELNIEVPEYLKNKEFNLYSNLFKNKAILLNEKIGLNKFKLKRLLKLLIPEVDEFLTYSQMQEELSKHIITKK